MFGILDKIKLAIKFVQVFGKLALVVGLGIAGFIWSPIARLLFLGIALGAAGLFFLEYNHIFEVNKVIAQYCINPNTVPGGPKQMCWKASNPDDPRDMYGTWEPCE